MVNEHVRNKLQEIEVILSFLFWLVLEILIDFAVLLKHVENSMSSIVYIAKELPDICVLRLMTEGY